MKILAVTRGAPGCGKSTFLKNHNLQQYALCADDIRLLYESPTMNHKDGHFGITQKNDRRVWELLFQLLEERMSRGEFCIVDATHSKSQDFAKYKKLIEKYHYRTYCIDFSDVSIETCKERNASRESHKRVSEEVIDNIYSRMMNQETPKYFKMINHNDEEAIKNAFCEYRPTDVNNFNKIVCFGDIHGCYEPFKEYFDKHPYSDDNLYVFLGDYIDRGTGNKEVVQWLLDHYQNNNVWLLQGNHEKWLTEYANGEYDEELKSGIKNKCKSSEFFEYTAKDLASFDKKDLRELCRKFRQMAFIDFDNNKFLFSHAGIGFMPDELLKVSANEFIRSNGKYEDPIDEWWENNEGMKHPNLYQIHGHRNIEDIPMHKFEHSINLCDTVEFGGNLRILEIEKN